MNESWENNWTKIAESPSLTTREVLPMKEFDDYNFVSTHPRNDCWQ